VLVMAAFMALMIAQIMGPVTVVMASIEVPAVIFIDSIAAMGATVAPVTVIIAVKMAVSGNPIALLLFQLVLSAGLCAIPFILLILLFLMAIAFVGMFSVSVLFIKVLSIKVLSI
jgi:hypothetical protein